MKYTVDLISLPAKALPLCLMLEADPSADKIQSYVADSLGFAAKLDDKIIASCVVQIMAKTRAEIMNMAVTASHQQQGIGSALLQYVLSQLSNQGITRVELGTGTFGHQLSFYQRAGFRVDTVVKDYFTQHYDAPIVENGITHQDMLRLSINLPLNMPREGC